LYLNFERALTKTEVEAVRELVRRRGQREPLQHILGSTSFCGLEITVNRHTLIPRPETELLAEHGWTFLNQHPGPGPSSSALNSQPSTALDFGTGSGCLAIALASKCVSVRVYALDVSAEALVMARLNAARHGLAGRIDFCEGDGFAALQSDARFDLIISNPPYIPSAEIETLQQEVRDHDPRTALDGGPVGMDFFRRLAAEAATYLLPHGKLMLEFGDGQAGEVGQIFEREKWIVEATHLDYNQCPRILIARRAD
jgi:release factor glutamine methyltransferase